MSLTEFQRKYLVRLSANAIEHGEFKRWGKRPVATILSLHGRGLVECTCFDGGAEIDPASHEGEFWWAITDAGLQAIGKS